MADARGWIATLLGDPPQHGRGMADRLIVLLEGLAVGRAGAVAASWRPAFDSEGGPSPEAATTSSGRQASSACRKWAADVNRRAGSLCRLLRSTRRGLLWTCGGNWSLLS